MKKEIKHINGEVLFTIEGDTLRFTDLRARDFEGADLGSEDLTGALLEYALYNNKTIFPIDFDPEEHGMLHGYDE